MADLQTIPKSDVLYCCWTAPKPRAILLLVYGLGAHAGRWQYLGQYFQEHQITSYALELKGFGATLGPRGYIDSFRTYDQDIARLLGLIRKQHPGIPVFLYGESMGGLIAFNFAARDAQGFTGLILGSAAFKSILSFPLSVYLTCFTSLLVNPQQLVALPFTSAMCTSDLTVRRTMDADPLELRVASAKLLINILLEQLPLRNAARKILLPTLFLAAGRDQFVDVRTIHQIHERLAAVDKTYLFYPEMLHVLHAEREREQVFQDILSWIQKRI